MSKASNKARLDKLRKLLALGLGNANEAEAAAAIRKAQEYAETHGLNLDDLADEVKREEAAEGYRKSGPLFSGIDKWADVDLYMWKAIAFFCDCKVGITRDDDGDWAIEYFGHEVDLELAQYLRVVIARAMEYEWDVMALGLGSDARPDEQSSAARKVAADKRRAVIKESFLRGMTDRLKQRMIDVRADRAMRTSGNQLVVLKQALLVQKAEEAGFTEAQGSKARSVAADAAAYHSGFQRGDAVNLGRGVADSRAKMIAK